MSGESSFEFINKKAMLESGENGAEDEKNAVGKHSLTSVQPPTSLPNFVSLAQSSGCNSSPPRVYHHTTSFSPVIPETKDDRMDSESKEPDEEGILGGPTVSGLFDWVNTVGNKGSSLLSKVAEKAKSSVDSVMVVLDPQLKGAELEITIASERETEVSAIRDAFQYYFGRSTIRGLEVDGIGCAKQVVGFDAASKVCTQKIENLKAPNSTVKGLIVAIQNFIVQLQEDKWYDLDLLILQGTEKPLHLESYTQMIPVPYSVVSIAKEDTAEDYKEKDTGFAVSIAHLMGSNLQVHPSEWQETLTGVSRRDRIYMAATVLVNLYKNTLL